MRVKKSVGQDKEQQDDLPIIVKSEKYWTWGKSIYCQLKQVCIVRNKT